MSTEELSQKFEGLDTDDVAEKRYQMFSIFQNILEEKYSDLNDLKAQNGYLYKLSQDFLLSSSTMEKENKLEKIIKYVE